jgi:hypothetical protein
MHKDPRVHAYMHTCIHVLADCVYKHPCTHAYTHTQPSEQAYSYTLIKGNSQKSSLVYKAIAKYPSWSHVCLGLWACTFWCSYFHNASAHMLPLYTSSHTLPCMIVIRMLAMHSPHATCKQEPPRYHHPEHTSSTHPAVHVHSRSRPTHTCLQAYVRASLHHATPAPMHIYNHACPHVHPHTHSVSHHQQLLAPEAIQVLDNLHVSSFARTHQAGLAILHTLAVRPSTCAVSDTPATPSALLLSLLTPAPEPTASVWCTCEPRVHGASLCP